jgi:hypothetical protein
LASVSATGCRLVEADFTSRNSTTENFLITVKGMTNFIFSVLSLYVGMAFCRAPQEWLRGILLFGFALFFNVCFGVV